jgi:hypothetical protein
MAEEFLLPELRFERRLTMKAKAPFVVFLLALAASGPAAQEPTAVDLSKPVQATQEWQLHPELWKIWLSEKQKEPTVSIGRQEFTVRGPLVDTLRASRSGPQDLSLDQKLMSLPVINLLVPQRMPSPPTGRVRYLAWRGESDLPWVAVVQGEASVSKRPELHEPQGALISLSR